MPLWSLNGSFGFAGSVGLLGPAEWLSIWLLGGGCGFGLVVRLRLFGFWRPTQGCAVRGTCFALGRWVARDARLLARI